MQDTQAITARGADTQRKGEWTTAEKAKLKAIASSSTRKEALLAMFPGRSLATIKLHLYAVRRELGLPKRGLTSNLQRFVTGPPMLDPEDEGIADDWMIHWKRRANISNARFLEAIQQAA